MAHKTLFNKSSSASGGSRCQKTASIRGKISAPIPFPDPLDDNFTVTPVQSPTGPAMPLTPMSIPHAITIPEGQPISMPIVPNSTLAHAVSTDTPLPQSAMNSSVPPGTALASPSSDPVSKTPSPVSPIDLNQSQMFSGSRGPSTAPLPAASPSPTIPMNNATSMSHIRTFSHGQIRRENGPAPTIPARNSNRGKPPLSHAIVRTSAALSIGTDKTSNTDNSNTSNGHTVSSINSRPLIDIPNDVNIPMRKKSTLRTAIGKIFGKKRGRNGHTTKPSEAGTRSGFADAAKQTTIYEQRPTSSGMPLPSPKRSVSLPAHERDTERDRALRSHSVGPNDIVAIESARNSINLESTNVQSQLAAQIQSHQAAQERALFSDVMPRSGTSFNSKRRAASTGGDFCILPRNYFAEPSGLSPRPTSSQCRSRTPREGDEATAANQTNVSATRGDATQEIGKAITGHKEVLRNRRRSRSVPGITLDLSSTVRRRSDEIRYWRSSYGGGVLAQSPDSDTGPLTSELSPDSQADTQEDSRPKSPPQPFNFGTLTSMKITEAASLDSRVGDMESRVNRLEKTVSLLTGPMLPAFRLGTATSSAQTSTTLSPQDRVLSGAPTLLNNSHISDIPTLRPPSSRRSEDSHMSFGQAPTFIGSLHAAPAPAAMRAKMSAPVSPKISPEQYSSLLSMIETERAARETLETEVRRLSRALNMAQASMQQLAPSTSAVQLSSSAPPARNFSLRHPAGSAPGVFVDDDDDDDDDEESAYAEDNTTCVPGETEGGEQHGFGAFGEELRERDRKTARTLSLSQLTHGTKPQLSEKQLEYEAEQQQQHGERRQQRQHAM